MGKKGMALLVCMLLALQLTGQPPQSKAGATGSVQGKIIDAETDKPVEYANIAIYWMPDSTLTTGTITNEEGDFSIKNIKFGHYTLIANFIGYEKSVIRNVIITPRNPNVNIPVISLKQASVELDAVDIEGRQTYVEYKIDKKVIRVGDDINATGGTAADALENVPSVDVDIEGNVTLRGSSNFTVLINGRPSVLDGSDALQQIPSSTIKNIEIITNPSAKYDPEGTAGIINVITKDQSMDGLSGNFEVGAGLNDKYHADALLSYKLGKIKITGGINYRDEKFQGERSTNRRTYSEDTTSFLLSNGKRNMHRSGTMGRLGLDWYLTPKTTLGLSGRYGQFNFGFGGYTKDKKWNDPGEYYRYYRAEHQSPHDRSFYNTDLSFQHKFDNKGHQLDGLVHYSENWGTNDEATKEWTSNENWEKIDSTLHKKGGISSEEETELRIKLDYARPVGENGKFSTGYQGRMEDEIEDYDYYDSFFLS